MGLFSRRAPAHKTLHQTWRELRAAYSEWQPDGTGVESNGDIGGDIQRGDSYSVRFARRDLPGSLLEVTFYAAGYDSNPGEFFVQRRIERTVLADPPGSAEIWSDCTSDDLGNDGEFWHSAVDAEWAACGYAMETLADGSAYFGWDGQPYYGETG